MVITHLKIVPSTMIRKGIDCKMWSCWIYLLIKNINSNNYTQTYHEEHQTCDIYHHEVLLQHSWYHVYTSTAEDHVYLLQHAHIIQHHQCQKDIPDEQAPKLHLLSARPI